MSKRTKKTLSDLLNESEIALTNAENQPEIKAALEAVSFGSEKIAEGRALRENTKNLSSAQQREFAESTEASLRFKTAKKETQTLYAKHRKRAKSLFEENTTALSELKLLGKQSTIHTAWRDMTEHFYKALLNNADYMAAMATMNVQRDEVEQAKASIQTMDTAYTEYIREKGESEEATRLKDAAARELELFMSRFWKIARIALEDKPQLMESLKKVVKR